MNDVPGDAAVAADLIYDWNEVDRRRTLAPGTLTVFDETLRDGLQNPSVRDPPVKDKLEILRLAQQIGVGAACLGLPASSPRAYDDVLRLCREAARCKMGIGLACAGRTVASDIEPIVDISQRAGVPLEVYAFIGSSPIRQYAERWDVALAAKRSAEAIDVAVKAGLKVCYVTEDTTRSRPEALATLFRTAIDHGARRLCLSDTVGHATPEGVRSLVRFTRGIIDAAGADGVGIDFHGHNDRGLALENAFAALEAGADRVHATALGIGERVGNVPMELLLVNLKLLGPLAGQELTRLLEYTRTVARALGWEIPINYPLAGRDAFRTATGVHAAAIVKAMARGNAWLADRIYSGIPAGMFGRSQEICIGFMSGASNVRYWLKQRRIPSHDGLVDEVLRAAKSQTRLMTEREVMAVVDRWMGKAKSA